MANDTTPTPKPATDWSKLGAVALDVLFLVLLFVLTLTGKSDPTTFIAIGGCMAGVNAAARRPGSGSSGGGIVAGVGLGLLALARRVPPLAAPVALAVGALVCSGVTGCAWWQSAKTPVARTVAGLANELCAEADMTIDECLNRCQAAAVGTAAPSPSSSAPPAASVPHGGSGGGAPSPVIGSAGGAK